ncbi:MAG: SUF system Fe-S cluster assembly regulator [Gammaproteobacteria bacterium]
MLRLSKLTDYGTVVLAHMARNPEGMYAATDVAEATHLAVPTVSKLLKCFVHAGLVSSQRGARGGYSLTRAPELINAVEIIDAVEGPIAITECSLGHNRCSLERVCAVGQPWQRITLALRAALATVTLAQLARPAAVTLPQLDLGATLSHTRQPRT